MLKFKNAQKKSQRIIKLNFVESNKLLLNYLIIFPCQEKKIVTLNYRRIHSYIERKEH